MTEDSADGARGENRRHETHATATVGTLQDVELEAAAHELGPGAIARRCDLVWRTRGLLATPRAACAAPIGGRFGALGATSRQLQVNERKGLAAIHRTTFRNDMRSDAARSSTKRGLRIHSPKHAFRLTDRPKTSYILLEADVCGVIRTNQLGS